MFDTEIQVQNHAGFGIETQIPAHDQAVWKTFWTIFFGAAIAADSSSAISAELSLQPSAPRFSSTCLTVLTPGIGIVPLQMHQLMATCVGRMASSSDYEEHFDDRVSCSCDMLVRS